LRAGSWYQWPRLKCFYHPDRDAVALCKSCNRGICLDCSAEVAPGMACRGRCEAEVAALNLVLLRSKTAYQKTGTAYRRLGLAYLIMGLLFVAFGIVPVLVSGNYGTLFFALLGGIFLLMSFFSFRSGKQIAEVSEPGDLSPHA
jgi:hypothetical protein